MRSNRAALLSHSNGTPLSRIKWWLSHLTCWIDDLDPSEPPSGVLKDPFASHHSGVEVPGLRQAAVCKCVALYSRR